MADLTEFRLHHHPRPEPHECRGESTEACPWIDEIMNHWTGRDILLMAADRDPWFRVNYGEEAAIFIIMKTGGPNEVRELMGPLPVPTTSVVRLPVESRDE